MSDIRKNLEVGKSIFATTNNVYTKNFSYKSAEISKAYKAYGFTKRFRAGQRTGPPLLGWAVMNKLSGIFSTFFWGGAPVLSSYRFLRGNAEFVERRRVK